jgi:rhomboid protease GluP
MFKRQTSGSVVCVSCGYLVGVNDDKCYHCGRRNPGLWGYAAALRSLGHDMGFVPIVTGLCLIVYVLTLLWPIVSINLGGDFLDILSPDNRNLITFGASGVYPVFIEGRWWTVLSAGWLHGNLLHIGFNLLWIRQLAPAVGELYGPGRMVVLYTAGSVAGFALSSLAGLYLTAAPGFLRAGLLTVGASAPIFGLLGALVYYGKRTGASHVHSQALSWALIMGVFGFIIPGVDNYAHAGGFAGGYFAGRLLDPIRPERVNHLAIGVGCLAASVLAMLASIIDAVLNPI